MKSQKCWCAPVVRGTREHRCAVERPGPPVPPNTYVPASTLGQDTAPLQGALHSQGRGALKLLNRIAHWIPELTPPQVPRGPSVQGCDSPVAGTPGSQGSARHSPVMKPLCAFIQQGVPGATPGAGKQKGTRPGPYPQDPPSSLDTHG